MTTLHVMPSSRSALSLHLHLQMPFHFDTVTVPRTPNNCATSRKRSRQSITHNSVKKRRISLASVDLSRELSSVTCPEFTEETAADRFIPTRPKSYLPLNITPRTNRIARVFGLADERLLSFSDAAAATPEVKMFSLLRKSASQLFQSTPVARSTSVLSNLGVRKQFVLALDGPGVPASVSAYPMAWSSTNSIAVASGNDIYYQNLEDRTISHLCRLSGSQQILHGIEWGGKEMQDTLASGTAIGTVQLWDASVAQRSDAGEALRSWTDSQVSCVGGMNWHGRSLAVGRSGEISIYDVREKNEMKRVKGHCGQVDGVKFSHDGRYLASGDHGGGVYIWDTRVWKSLSDENRRGRLVHGGPVKALAWCPWKPDLVATGSMFPEGKIRVWSTNSFRSSPLHKIPLNTDITSLHWSPHCKEILSTHGSSWAPPTGAARLRGVLKFTQVHSPLTNSITVHSYPTFMRLVSVVAHSGTVGHSCLSPDGTMVFTICPKEESMKMWKVWGQREGVERQESVFDKCAIR